MRTLQAVSYITGMGEARPCRCGCGGLVRELDDRARPREWLRGHYLKWLTERYRTALARGRAHDDD